MKSLEVYALHFILILIAACSGAFASVIVLFIIATFTGEMLLSTSTFAAFLELIAALLHVFDGFLQELSLLIAFNEIECELAFLNCQLKLLQAFKS